MAALRISAKEGDVWREDIRFSGTPICFPHGHLTAKQIETLTADEALLVEPWVDAQAEFQEPPKPEGKK
jgi:hypothetical protein